MSGRKAGVNISANTDTNLYSPGGSTLGTYTVAISNRNTSGTAVVRLGLSASFGALDWTVDTIQPDISLNAGAVLEVSGVVAAAANAIVGRSNSAGVTFVVMGVEQ